MNPNEHAVIILDAVADAYVSARALKGALSRVPESAWAAVMAAIAEREDAAAGQWDDFAEAVAHLLWAVEEVEIQAVAE